MMVALSLMQERSVLSPSLSHDFYSQAFNTPTKQCKLQMAHDRELRTRQKKCSFNLPALQENVTKTQ